MPLFKLEFLWKFLRLTKFCYHWRLFTPCSALVRLYCFEITYIFVLVWNDDNFWPCNSVEVTQGGAVEFCQPHDHDVKPSTECDETVWKVRVTSLVQSYYIR
jgi:hypothetical protein